jgi:hypothetical protein
MRRILLAWVFLVGGLGTCGCDWGDKAEKVQRTGNGVLLFPTDREQKAGYE